MIRLSNDTLYFLVPLKIVSRFHCMPFKYWTTFFFNNFPATIVLSEGTYPFQHQNSFIICDQHKMQFLMHLKKRKGKACFQVAAFH